MLSFIQIVSPVVLVSLTDIHNLGFSFFFRYLYVTMVPVS